MNKIIKKLLCLTLAALTIFSTTSCFYFGFSPDYDGTPEGIYSSGLISEDMFLVAEGESLKTLGGQEITLRGVNLGGLFVTENWMNSIFKETRNEEGRRVRIYDKLISETFIKRFGEDGAKALWEEYRSNYISDEDFKLMKDMGINVIRLPITYMTVDFDAITDYKNAGDYDFSLVDAIIEKAASYGIYTILDLHGAYGSQNGADHSG
jgi:aryl-phospho-beta-D-glucosidase BglC (GH1 family)